MTKDLIRKYCCICNSKLKTIIRFEKYPIKFCMSDDLYFEYATLSFCICSQCNTIQLNKLIDLDLLYNNPHNNNIIGKTWTTHFDKFSKFITNNCKSLKNVLEIGGSTDKLVKNINNYTKWVLLDPNSQKYNNSKILNINNFFNKKFTPDTKIHTIVNSHLLEHLYFPVEIIQKMYNILEDNGNIFISIPNMEAYSKITPFLGMHFEHTYFLNECNINYIFNINNFKIINKGYFNKHSIFYHVKKGKTDIISTNVIKEYNMTFLYLFHEKIEYFKNLVENINNKIKNKNNIFLFGCHSNTQFLIYMKLNISNITCILDNDTSKHNKFFYGSSLICKSPNIIKEIDNPMIICYIGSYNKEVQLQLKTINKNVIFL
jgi:hypothetical protein